MADLMNDTPWASFCMSTYKRPGMLRKTLALLREQTFRNFEVVISDNDPECSAESIVQDFHDPRLRYFPNKANLGVLGSYNKSIGRSRGQFIITITDDDPVYPNMLQTLYDLQLKYPGYGIYSGGHDTVFTGVTQARMAKARVGTNSGLLDWDLGIEKAFSPSEYLQAFADGTVGHSTLWSTAAIRRDIVEMIGGLPDYGTPHLADCALLILSGARAGGVYVNTAVGVRTIHDQNFSYAEANYELVCKAPEAFYKYTLKQIPASLNTPQFQRQLAHYVGLDMTTVVITTKKMLTLQGIKSEKFEDFRRRFFQLPMLRKWKTKYLISVHYPNLFNLLLDIRRMISPKASRR